MAFSPFHKWNYPVSIQCQILPNLKTVPVIFPSLLWPPLLLAIKTYGCLGQKRLSGTTEKKEPVYSRDLAISWRASLCRVSPLPSPTPSRSPPLRSLVPTWFPHAYAKSRTWKRIYASQVCESWKLSIFLSRQSRSYGISLWNYEVFDPCRSKL